MIVDTLDNTARYEAVHPGLGAAFAHIRSIAAAPPEPGKHDVDGDRLYVMVVKGKGNERADAGMESHEAYIDIHYTVAGNEEMGWKPTPQCADVSQPYSAEGDCALYRDRPDLWVGVPEGTFAVCFPEDAHAPMSGAGEVCKIVAKVAVDWK